MLKKLSFVLNIVMGSAAGAFIGHGAYVVWDYRAHPGLYAMGSAPWYTGILVCGVCTAAALALCVILKLILRRRAERQT